MAKSSCKNCGCSKIDCGCKDNFLTSPAPCPTPDDCPEAQPCSEVFDAACIIYNGPSIQCNDVVILESGSSISDALVSLIEYIQDLNHVVCGPAGCRPAYEYLTDYALVNSSSTISPAEVLDQLLDIGITIPIGNAGICCPVCGPYVLASVETWLKWGETFGCTGENIENCTCCTNVYASVETYLKYAEATGAPAIGCNNGFTEEVLELVDLLISTGEPGAPQMLLDKGIVETGSLNADLTSNVSDLQSLVEDLFESPNNSGTQYSSIPEILERILDKGLVISCINGELVVASVETWLPYYEATDLPPVVPA